MGEAGPRALWTPGLDAKGSMAVGTPTPVLAALLCLDRRPSLTRLERSQGSLPGLCEGPRDQVQAGTPPKPSIWAIPGPWIPKGSPVTIWCQGPSQAAEYRVYKEGSPEFHVMDSSPGPRSPANFSIRHMSKRTAGPYLCAYGRPGHWSEHSDPLGLVVTGVYDAPWLSVQPGSPILAGENVTFTCSSIYSSGTFHLLMEQSTGPPRDLGSPVSQEDGLALFRVGPVSASHQGTYRCYRNPNIFPYVWSQPSEGLHLQVTGLVPQDYTVGNLIRVGMAIPILLLLALLLYNACHSDPGRQQDSSNMVEMMRLEGTWGPK